MHCKNFSLIDGGNRQYSLAPAYDLLAVLLADPADQEEMALTLTVGGSKTGFDSLSFLSAMEQTGVASSVAGKMIRHLCACSPDWNAWIDKSFLPDNLKIAYKRLLEERLSRLQ